MVVCVRVWKGGVLAGVLAEQAERPKAEVGCLGYVRVCVWVYGMVWRMWWLLQALKLAQQGWVYVCMLRLWQWGKW